jgi:hypothetical protein
MVLLLFLSLSLFSFFVTVCLGGKVHYDKVKRGNIPFLNFDKDELYDEVMLRKGMENTDSHHSGYGCLLSFELKSEINVKVIFLFLVSCFLFFYSVVTLPFLFLLFWLFLPIDISRCN